MTVSSETARWDYVGDGSNDVFQFTAEIYDETDLEVYVDDILQTINVAYTIPSASVNNPAGGNVEFETAYIPAADASVVILLDIPLTQETNFVEGDKFPAETHETALDRLTKICQAIKQSLSHAVRFASYAATDLVMPDPSANLYIGWNSDASNLENKSGPVLYDATLWEIDALVTYGGGTAYTKATIDAALTAIGTSTKVTLLLRPGNWTITASSDYSSYSNVTFKLPNGAYLTVSAGQTLILPSPNHVIALPIQQVFAGAGTVVFAAPGTVYPEWWGIDGTADDVQMNAACVSLNAGGKVQLTKAAYSLSDEVNPITGTTFHIPRETTVTLAAASNSPMISTISDNVTIEGGGILDGNRANQTGGSYTHCIYAANAEWITIKDVRVQSAYLDNIYITGCENTRITDIENSDAENNGVTIVNSDFTRITGSHFHDNVNSSGTANIRAITGCKTVIITGNEFHDSGEIAGEGHGIYTVDCEGVIVTGNYFDNMYGWGVELNSPATINDTAIVSGNIFNDCGHTEAESGGVLVGEDYPAIITGNAITGAAWYGIYFGDSERVVANGNNILDCQETGSVGIRLLDVVAAALAGNMISDTSGSPTTTYGITLEDVVTATLNVAVAGNTMTDMTNSIILGQATAYKGGNIESFPEDWIIGNTFDGIQGQLLVLADAYTIGPGYSGVYFLDPGGAHRDIVCSAGFKQNSIIIIVNQADAAENLVFDSAGIAEAVGQDERGIFAFDGTNWVTIFVG